MLEAYGIATVCLSINRGWSLKVPGPRNMLVRFPYGAAFGEPGEVDQQMTVLRDLLWVLQTASEPGALVERPYRWRRSTYETVDPAELAHPAL